MKNSLLLAVFFLSLGANLFFVISTFHPSATKLNPTATTQDQFRNWHDYIGFDSFVVDNRKSYFYFHIGTCQSDSVRVFATTVDASYYRHSKPSDTVMARIF
jgi:hypothetical protein